MPDEEITLTYASVETVRGWLELDGSDWESVTAGAVRIAELDIDLMLPEAGRTTAGLKLDPSALFPYQQQALGRAVAEQVRFRAVMPAGYVERPQHASVSQDGASTQGRLPRWSPVAQEVLADAGLLRAWADAPSVSAIDAPTGPKRYLGLSFSDGIEG